jgi:DNA polymerase I-like protein with 3'-5' exonuclease and polymerase domains
MEWDIFRHTAFDFETSGTKPEHALQPWRARAGDFWATSLVWVNAELVDDELAYPDQGGLEPSALMMSRMLEQALDERKTLVGWNTVFDISVLMAYGLEKRAYQCKWLDGMLLWRHLEVEPEYDMMPRSKKSFGLKTAVAKFMPEHAGYEEDVNFHDPSPAARAKLHAYNVRDSTFTLQIAGALWDALNERQRRAALIEAECLPMLAEANLRGLLIDRPVVHALKAKLDDTVEIMSAKLGMMGVDEVVIRSPVKLAKVLFEDWGLPVLKLNKSKKTGKTTRSTDKSVLHELGIHDPRVKDIRAYREALNNRTKFCDGPLISSAYNDDGCSHPLVGAFKTYSGRMSYSSKQRAGRKPKDVEIEVESEDA